MEKSIGGLWLKEKGDLKYYTGTLEIDGKKVKIIVFKNKFKNKDSQPDLRVYPSTAKAPMEADKAFL